MNENEMKSLENRLRSWRPRRPSATLKWRLFLARAADGARVAHTLRMLRLAGWLTPATACLLLALLAANSENGLSTGGPRLPSLPLMTNNQSYVVYATCRQSEQNNVSAFTFDWTNRSSSGSFNGFPQFRKLTN